MKEFKAILNEQLPTIYDQVKTRKLKNLDEAILKAIGIKDTGKLLDHLYSDLLLELDRTEIDNNDRNVNNA